MTVYATYSFKLWLFNRKNKEKIVTEKKKKEEKENQNTSPQIPKQ